MLDKQLSRVFIILGIIFIIFGLLLRFHFFGLGKLPGGIMIKKENFTFYFPLATSIVISIAVSIIFFIIFQNREK